MIERKFHEEVPFTKVRLHSSEKISPWGFIFEEFKNSLTDEDIRYYPNRSNVYSKLQNFYGYDSLIMGFGSDRCIKYFFELHQKTTNIITTDPCFPMYPVYGDIFNMNITKVPYNGTKFPIQDILKSYNEDSVFVFSNPSSPIGDLISREDIITILEHGIPTLIDEAYIEFSNGASCIDLLDEYDNLYITRTFSKALGSAGIRFGVMLSQKQNLDLVFQYRDMYENSGLSLKWVDTLLKHTSKINEYIQSVKDTRSLLISFLKNKNIEFVPSESNWIHIKGNFDIPSELEIRDNCTIPGLGDGWIRLCVAEDMKYYNWL